MSTFYCIYGGSEYPAEQRSLEHIVPYALGGPADFGTNDVAVVNNNNVGTRVDKMMVSHPFIAIERWRLGLKGSSGEVPSIVFPGTVDVNGKTLRVKCFLHPDGTVELQTIPEVQSDWSGGEFSINCDPAELARITADIEKKAAKKGISFPQVGLTPTFSSRVRIENPTIATEWGVGIFDLVPGFVKMALGTGHLVLGYPWSRSSDADLLRSVINEADPEKWRKINLHGFVWPNGEDPLGNRMSLGNDHHVLAVINSGTLVFYGLLFGRFHAFIQLARGVWQGPELPPGSGVVFSIDCCQRKMTQHDYGQFVTYQTLRAGVDLTA